MSGAEDRVCEHNGPAVPGYPGVRFVRPYAFGVGEASPGLCPDVLRGIRFVVDSTMAPGTLRVVPPLRCSCGWSGARDHCAIFWEAGIPDERSALCCPECGAVLVARRS